jgi:hypothetical protein
MTDTLLQQAPAQVGGGMVGGFIGFVSTVGVWWLKGAIQAAWQRRTGGNGTNGTSVHKANGQRAECAERFAAGNQRFSEIDRRLATCETDIKAIPGILHDHHREVLEAVSDVGQRCARIEGKMDM